MIDVSHLYLKIYFKKNTFCDLAFQVTSLCLTEYEIYINQYTKQNGSNSLWAGINQGRHNRKPPRISLSDFLPEPYACSRSVAFLLDPRCVDGGHPIGSDWPDSTRDKRITRQSCDHSKTLAYKMNARTTFQISLDVPQLNRIRLKKYDTYGT